MGDTLSSYHDAIQWLNAKFKTGCKHEWVYTGHGHNYDCYQCQTCHIEGDY